VELVLPLTVVETTPPLIETVAPLTTAPAEVFTVTLIFPDVAIPKLTVVVPPAVTVAVFVCDPQPLLVAFTDTLPVGTDDNV
jgi:hypothetical protein